MAGPLWGNGACWEDELSQDVQFSGTVVSQLSIKDRLVCFAPIFPYLLSDAFPALCEAQYLDEALCQPL